MHNLRKSTLDKIAKCIVQKYPIILETGFLLRHLYGSHHNHVKLGNVNTAEVPESLRAVKSKI